MNEAKTIGSNALVLDTRTVGSRVEEQQLDREVSLIEQKASAVVVETDEDYVAASLHGREPAQEADARPSGVR